MGSVSKFKRVRKIRRHGETDCWYFDRIGIDEFVGIWTIPGLKVRYFPISRVSLTTYRSWRERNLWHQQAKCKQRHKYAPFLQCYFTSPSRQWIDDQHAENSWKKKSTKGIYCFKKTCSNRLFTCGTACRRRLAQVFKYVPSSLPKQTPQ